MEDYYKILELDRSAGVIEIRKSYRRLALKLHPDVNTSKNANSEFIALGEAYEVLKNPIKRKRYDRLYDYKVLGKKPERPNTFDARSNSWAQTVAQRQKRGKYKANINRAKSYQKFKKKTQKTSLFDWVWGILEFFGSFVDIFAIFG